MAPFLPWDAMWRPVRRDDRGHLCRNWAVWALRGRDLLGRPGLCLLSPQGGGLVGMHFLVRPGSNHPPSDHQTQPARPPCPRSAPPAPPSPGSTPPTGQGLRCSVNVLSPGRRAAFVRATRLLCKLAEECRGRQRSGSLAVVQGLDGLVNTFPSCVPHLAVSAVQTLWPLTFCPCGCEAL